LQISLAWPPELKELLKYFSFINFNIEIVRPDCSIAWDAEKKMWTYLLMPFAVLALIFMYGLFKYLIHEQVAQSSGALYDRRFAAVKASASKMVHFSLKKICLLNSGNLILTLFVLSFCWGVGCWVFRVHQSELHQRHVRWF
jgi:hypothetical protein